MPDERSELYKLIKVSGPDAVLFLQGQLTQDVSRLTERGALLAAWLNAKGRVMAIIRVVKCPGAIGLIVPATLADRIVQRLTMYRLRSRVEFSEPGPDWIEWVDGDQLDPLALIRAGVPTIDDRNTEAYTPHMLNLDKLGAISFNKGCYTGQEVVARTEHLGKSKRRLMCYEADCDTIDVNARLSDDGRDVGTVVNAAGHLVLAVTPVEIHRQALTAGDVSLTPLGLPYSLGIDHNTA